MAHDADLSPWPQPSTGAQQTLLTTLLVVSSWLVRVVLEGELDGCPVYVMVADCTYDLRLNDDHPSLAIIRNVAGMMRVCP